MRDGNGTQRGVAEPFEAIERGEAIESVEVTEPAEAIVPAEVTECTEAIEPVEVTECAEVFEPVEVFEVFSRDGTPIRGFSRPGPGETLVLVHGVAMDRWIWPESGFLDALPDAHVLALDLRGRGESGRVGTPEGHALRRYVEDVRAVLDGFGHDRYSLFGTFFGGRIALQVAAVDPRVVRAFSFCAHAEQVEIPEDAVEEEAVAVEGPGGHAYLRDHFTGRGAPPWMVDACARVDPAELGAATRGLLHGSDRHTERGHPDQELILITATGDADLAPFHAGEKRLNAQLWLVDAPTRIKAAGCLAKVGRRVAGVLGEGRGDGGTGGAPGEAGRRAGVVPAEAHTTGVVPAEAGHSAGDLPAEAGHSAGDLPAEAGRSTGDLRAEAHTSGDVPVEVRVSGAGAV